MGQTKSESTQRLLDVRNKLNEIIETHTDITKLTAVCMPPGVGKSTYIKQLIAEGKEGAVIVTDRIKQVESYFTYTDENGESIIYEFPNAVYLTSDNLADTMPIVNLKNIVVMTMSRFFSMTVDEIKALSRWKNGKRTKIIIDEMPPLIEQRLISMKDLNDVHSALFESIDDTVDQAVKTWVIIQWKKFRDDMERRMNELEKAYSQNHDQFYTWFNLQNGITTDDDKFMRFIKANEKQLTQYGINHNGVDVMATIANVQKLRDYGGMYSCRLKKSGEYEKSFTVTINNMDKLTNLVTADGDSLKVYVMDGTSDLSPDYQQDYIDLIDCSQYYRDLSNLTIHVVDVNTSKKALNSYKPDCEQIKEIVKHIHYMNNLVITYKEYEKLFGSYVQYPDKQLGHFGAIRGDNDYNQMTYVSQIGLNRFPPIYYLLLHRELHRDFYDCMFGKLTDEYINELNRIINNHCLKSDNPANRIVAQEIYSMIELSLLADIEQNLFRTAIRNYNDNQPIVCTLVFDVKHHTELVNQMRNRFESHGATVIVHDKAQSLKIDAAMKRKAPNGQNKTNAQKIIEYIDSVKSGNVFKVSDMLKTIGISNQQLKDTKKMNKALAQKLNQMQTDVKGYYKKC